MTATGVQEASSSSSSSSRSGRYHVFLSFRGEDTRRTFVDHLYTALTNAGFRTFRDDDELERGENIKVELQRAIEESRVSIVVFSRNYASSSWCLDELATILGRRQIGDSGYAVLPVFYGVDPSDVRKQKGDYAEAFAKHEEQLKFKGGEGEAKLKGWREALEQAANLAGMDLHKQTDGYESKFIQQIIKEVEVKLRRPILNVALYTIGLYFRASSVNLWVEDGWNDTRIATICGMGGIGKTTIAKFVYNLNFSKFEGSCFLMNIREISKQQDGLIHLQKQLLSNILSGRKVEVNSVDEGIIKIKGVVGSKRVLIVLDDVDKWEQLYALLGMHDWLSSGSKVIITTRREHLLGAHKYLVHRVDELDHKESLELFSWYAFGQDHPSDGFLVHSERAVKFCGGLPLAIKTLGSSLSGKSLDVWRSQLQKLQAIPDSDIFEKLKLSYDSIQDDHDMDLFLDIACFFVGKDKDVAVRILDGCDFSTLAGIQNLIDRNLLTVDRDNKLVMHQLIQEMGREIVRQESPKELGERSRLWNHKDSFIVLREETGTRKIRGLVLDMHLLKEDKSEWNSLGAHRESCSKKRKRDYLGFFFRLPVGTATKNSNVVLKVDAFAGMSKLQFLQISDLQLCGNYENFPRGLRWLCWSHFPLQVIPNDFPLDRLVALEMPHSCLEKVFNGTKCLVLLKILDLSHSHNLFETPDFSILPNLERLVLENCTRLVKVHESIGHLGGLVFLSFKNCRNLRKLPENICRLKSLATTDISDCINLENIPTELGNMYSLTVLHADGTAINQLLSITPEVKAQHLSIWTSPLNRTSCPRSSWISFPPSLVHLSLANCNLSDDSFPREFSDLSSLQILNLSNNLICSLPNSIRDLCGLRELHLESCPKLKSVDGLPQNLDLLQASQSELLEKINFPRNRGLVGIGYYGCMSLVEIVGLLKLEPLESVDAELINNLGLCNVEAMEKPPVGLCINSVYERKRMLPPQGLDESRTFSTYLRGNKISMSFNLKKKGSSISFTVPFDVSFKIQGLSVCSIYGSNHVAHHPPCWRQQRWGLITTISNATKHLTWSYSPSLFGFPGADEDLMWLSYWRFEDQLEGGDKVNISVANHPLLQVKEVGVRLVYKEAEEKNSSQQTSLEVAQQIHPYGKVVPAFCVGDCEKCNNYLAPVNPASTKVFLLGNHPQNCRD